MSNNKEEFRKKPQDVDVNWFSSSPVMDTFFRRAFIETAQTSNETEKAIRAMALDGLFANLGRVDDGFPGKFKVRFGQFKSRTIKEPTRNAPAGLAGEMTFNNFVLSFIAELNKYPKCKEYYGRELQELDALSRKWQDRKVRLEFTITHGPATLTRIDWGTITEH
jgi:hypothetical protein